MVVEEVHSQRAWFVVGGCTARRRGQRRSEARRLAHANAGKCEAFDLFFPTAARRGLRSSLPQVRSVLFPLPRPLLYVPMHFKKLAVMHTDADLHGSGLSQSSSHTHAELSVSPLHRVFRLLTVHRGLPDPFVKLRIAWYS